MQQVLLIDNYDSFTWNLVQILRESGLCRYEVAFNDCFAVEDCRDFDKLLISPGPGLPHEAGKTCDTIRAWASAKSILGVCLGHQAIGTVFGAGLKQLPHPMHGFREQVSIMNPDSIIFKGLPAVIETGHYHSWVIDHESLPQELEVTAQDSNQNIMAIQHRSYHVFGIQFHPESLMTKNGRQLVINWLQNT